MLIETVLSALLRPRVGPWRHALALFPAAIFPSAALFKVALTISVATGLPAQQLMPPDRSPSMGEVLGAVAFAPVAETLLLAAGLRILCLLKQSLLVTAGLSAVIWGLLHAVQGALWFFGTFWSFFLFSCAFLVWRQRSFAHAFIAASVPHALVNGTAMALLAVRGAA
ncbi:hypothetical protein AACH10_13390 [Ideonella sp. DXS22W]|uniref:CPBP family intramembrane metalloprotease n=1 Tax=Pseudaquabacterium inlustre TaxID=2984192 RepID=A0ABU9CHA5_9BURK